MTTNDQNRLIALELTLDDLGWLRAFLDQERAAATIDHADAKALHNALAARSAVQVLNSEIATMTKIIDEINRLLAAIDKHESLARKIATTVPGVPDSLTPTTKQGEEL